MCKRVTFLYMYVFAQSLKSSPVFPQIQSMTLGTVSTHRMVFGHCKRQQDWLCFMLWTNESLLFCCKTEAIKKNLLRTKSFCCFTAAQRRFSLQKSAFLRVTCWIPWKSEMTLLDLLPAAGWWSLERRPFYPKEEPTDYQDLANALVEAQLSLQWLCKGVEIPFLFPARKVFLRFHGFVFNEHINCQTVHTIFNSNGKTFWFIFLFVVQHKITFRPHGLVHWWSCEGWKSWRVHMLRASKSVAVVCRMVSKVGVVPHHSKMSVVLQQIV